MTIVSHAHGFAFLKTIKTGSTSVEVDLSRVAGPDAVVTPIRPAEEGHWPRNYLGPDGQAVFANHMHAARLREALGDRTFDGLFKFCVLREPVAKCLSHYHMKLRSPLHNDDGNWDRSWDAYVEQGQFPNDLNIFSAAGPGGRVALVDHFVAYETMARDLPPLMARLGVPGFALRARAKSAWSRDPVVQPADVTPAQRARIYAAYADMRRLSGLYGG